MITFVGSTYENSVKMTENWLLQKCISDVIDSFKQGCTWKVLHSERGHFKHEMELTSAKRIFQYLFNVNRM